MTAELIDATPLLEDPAALVEQFQRDGYLFFRGLVERQTVLDVRGDVARAIASVGWLAQGTDPTDAVPGPDIRREADEHWWPGYAAIQSQESFHRLAHHPRLLEPVRALAGTDELLVHPRKIGRVTFPKSEHPTPPHQDFPLIQGGADVFTIWMPFGDVPAEMGGLRLLEGSHRDGLRPPVSATGVGGVGVQVTEDDPRWRTTDYLAGDAVVFLSFTVHWAPANHADRVRLSGDFRYQALSEPVVEGSLYPHYGEPLIPSWDVLSQGWSSRQWIETPPGTRIVELDFDLEHLQAPASRFVQAGGRG
jgi:ectoine hydroxylase-related dioxygenase (phytanoyl-CoA dioxygenase family)